MWAVGLAVGATALAQPPDAGHPGSAPPAPAITAEALATPTPADTPTRQPQWPTDTASATATATDTATPPPSATATRRPPSATATTVPPTPTPTRWLAALGSDSGGALPLLVGGGLALLGAWLGAVIAGASARSARRRARRTLATAMLIELRRMDSVLRRVVGLDNPASFPSLDHAIMESALHDLTLFRTETAARIAQFHGALRGIQHEIGDYRDDPLRWAGRLGELNQLIKARAAAACRAVPDLMKALEREGGAPPPHLGEPSAAATASPDLPPPPFKGGDGDDWTL